METNTIKSSLVTTITFLVFFLSSNTVSSFEQSQQTTIDKLLNILQDKGIITEEQYRDLKNELSVEKKAMVEQKK